MVYCQWLRICNFDCMQFIDLSLSLLLPESLFAVLNVNLEVKTVKHQLNIDCVIIQCSMLFLFVFFNVFVFFAFHILICCDHVLHEINKTLIVIILHGYYGAKYIPCSARTFFCVVIRYTVETMRDLKSIF